MTIHEELARQSPSGDTALTIGIFDGVHLGHQKLLQSLKALALKEGLLSAVLTFRNHPRLVLRPGVKLQCLTTLEDRVSRLKELGLGPVIVVDFTTELSILKAREFVELLSGHLRMKGLVVGPDFALGHQREGDVPTLKGLGEELGFRVEPVELAVLGDSVVRSSTIRARVSEGEVENASRMLGRWYSLTGHVVEGDRRGRELGFPTANLALDPNLVIPRDGIYATWAIVEGRRHQAATSIGVRPTFGTGQRTVEAFILDFEGDLYGKPLTLEFPSRLREERAFDTVEELVDQMEVDVEQARAVLSSPPVVLTKSS